MRERWTTLGPEAARIRDEFAEYWPRRVNLTPQKTQQRTEHLNRLLEPLRDRKGPGGQRLLSTDAGYRREYHEFVRELLPGDDVSIVG